VSHDRKSRGSTLHDATDTAFAMVMLWAIPVFAFVFALTRM
jgi:hypothetical protein